jgi:hypothetical protein
VSGPGESPPPGEGREFPGGGQGPAPSEEELRARLEEELRRLKVEDVLLQTIVTLVNLGAQRLGAAPAAGGPRDLGQVRVAIEGVRALLPLLEGHADSAQTLRPIRDALSQLQMAYAREAGAETEAEPAAGEPEGQAAPDQEARPGPAEPPRRGTSGRLWVPPGSG